MHNFIISIQYIVTKIIKIEGIVEFSSPNLSIDSRKFKSFFNLSNLRLKKDLNFLESIDRLEEHYKPTC